MACKQFIDLCYVNADPALVEAAEKLARLCTEHGLTDVQFNISGTKITVKKGEQHD